MSSPIKESSKVDPFLVFYLIHTAQVGVGVLGFQRTILKTVGFDAWMTVLLTGILLHPIIWMMYRILKNGNGDLIDIHHDLFGKWIGKVSSVFVLIYFLLASTTILRTYIEVIQVWMFPHISTWIFTLVFIILIYYVVSGGFKTVTGISFLAFLMTIPMFYFLVYPLEFANFGNLLPVMRVEVTDLVISVKDMVISLLGLELLLLYYPFIKHGEKSQKWAHYGLLFTTIIYLAITVISFSFYSEEQLSKTIWPTLSLFKVAEMPFVERVEYFGVSLWLFMILPNVVLYVWAGSRISKKVFHISQRKSLLIILTFLFLVIPLIKGRMEINKLSEMISYIGLSIVLAYIPFLFVLQWLIKRRNRSE